MKTTGKRAAALIFLCILAVCAICLGGCESEPGKKTSSGGKPMVGILVYKKDDAYVGFVSKAMQESLKDRAEVEVLFADGDQLIQNEQIGALLQRGAVGLAVNIVEIQAVAKVVDDIKKAGIPVVFFNREPDLSSLKGYAKARFVGTTANDAGVMQGDIIAELWRKHSGYDRNKDGRCRYLMLQGNLDNPEAIARTEYSVKRARELGLAMWQEGDSLLCNWDENLAYDSVRLVLPYRIDALELIIANNDSMALGAIRALNESGYNLEGGDRARFIPVVGVDAVPAAVEAIQKGMMSGTVIQDGGAMGRTVAGMLMNAVEGRDFLDGIPYNWDASGIAVRIPYARYTGAD